MGGAGLAAQGRAASGTARRVGGADRQADLIRPNLIWNRLLFSFLCVACLVWQNKENRRVYSRALETVRTLASGSGGCGARNALREMKML